MYVYTNPRKQSQSIALQEIADLQAERERLVERITWIDQRSLQLHDYLKVLEPLIEQDPGLELASAGLTQICIGILERNNAWTTAQAIRQQLAQIGIDISGYTNPMAVLHATLRRIAEVKTGVDGSTYYGPRGLAESAPTIGAVPLVNALAIKPPTRRGPRRGRRAVTKEIL